MRRQYYNRREKKMFGRAFVSRPWQLQRDVQSSSALCARSIRRVQRYPGACRIADNGHPLLAGHKQLSLSNIETAMIMRYFITMSSGLIMYGFSQSIHYKKASLRCQSTTEDNPRLGFYTGQDRPDQNAVHQT